MPEPWNDSFILPPPVHTTKSDAVIEEKQLQYICNSIIRVLSKQSPLHREAAICSRFLYKFDKKFRNDIGYRNFKKVNTALRKYLMINLLKDVDNFMLALPSSDDMYFPTRQMLEYVMVRLLTFSKIMVRINVCSKQASVFYLDRIKRGESHWMSLMPYALLSRIWSMSMVLLQHSCRWYTSFYPFLEKLCFKGLPFLPSGYKLPVDIEEWLDMNNLPNIGRFEWTQKKKLNFDQLFAEDEEGDTFENILDYVNQLNEEKSEEIEPEHVKPILQKHKDNAEVRFTNTVMDYGEKISRKSLETFFKNYTPEQKITHSADRVTNKVSLLQFITMEDKFRNTNNTNSLTGHLSFMQWQALKNCLETLNKSLSNNRKIQKKFQKMWKEKCLDYK